MENNIIFIFAAILIICLAVIFGFLIRMQAMMTATQIALAQSQHEMATMRRALTATNVQGQWGEMQLRRIVELAGMLSYCDFEPQVTLSGTDGSQRPDLLVRLSNGRTIVVDAKSPIDTYIQAHSSLDDATRAAHLRQYARHVKNHVMRLASKGYWQHFEPSPEWVVLFIPNEGMFRAAVEYDPQLLDTAMQKHVLLASPVTLLALLKAMAHGWQQEKRASSVHLLIEHSYTLQKQFKVFITQWNKLHNQLSGTVIAFNQLTMIYQTTIFPVIQQICDLDGTDAGKYDVSRTRPLQVPKSTEDLLTSTEEHLTEN